MTVIDTSTAATATAYSNQRKIDRCQNGVLWAVWQDATTGSEGAMAYSTDNGTTWTVVPGEPDGDWANGSLFIDVDDYAHVVYKDSSDGRIYYRRGTPNAARTAWTWSSAIIIQSVYSGHDYPDVIAHREGDGWAAHVVYERIAGVDWYVHYRSVNISSGGSLSLGTDTNIQPSGYPGNRWPSIDFHHTGDGKTVKDGTPHLYVAWSAGAVGAGRGIRFKKATYSSGSWTWGTEREIDSTRYVLSGSNWLNCLFDGTCVVLPGFLYDGSSHDLVLHERDEADTATTPRSLLENKSTTDAFYYGTATYDGDGNVYLFGMESASASGSRDLVYRKWTRATATLESGVIIDSTTDAPYASTKRGYSDGKIEFIYTDGTSSPYSVTYGSIQLNQPPTAPTNVGVNQLDATQNITITWDHNDPDGDPQAFAQAQVREKDSGIMRFTGTRTGATETLVIPGPGTLKSGTVHQVRVRTSDTEDEDDAYGPWSDWVEFTTSGRAPGAYYYDGSELVRIPDFAVEP